ncbi:MAG TPA: hypothetical protein VG839_03470 [Asticcacaulis sp.]|nr:hypothetical protein [Asticcacaulis sp.]
MSLLSEPVHHTHYKIVVDDLMTAHLMHKPYSLIRLGDGESAILGYPEFGHPQRYRTWMTNFFGTHVCEDALYAPLRADLEQAIRNADVIGTGSARLTDPAEGDKVLQAMGAIQHRTAEDNLAQNTAERLFLNYHLSRLVGLRGVLTSANIHIHLEQQGMLADLIGRSSAVTLIGCRDVTAALGDRFPDTQLRHFATPGEYKFEDATSREQWTKQRPHFPDVYNDLRASLRGGNFDDLVLVGAGPCGKVYCDDVRAAGGFALDIGSIMDLWGGVMTRSYMQRTKTATF